MSNGEYLGQGSDAVPPLRPQPSPPPAVAPPPPVASPPSFPDPASAPPPVAPPSAVAPPPPAASPPSFPDPASAPPPVAPPPPPPMAGFPQPQLSAVPPTPPGAENYTNVSSATVGGKPDNYLVWAILTTLLCCLPLGIVAIIKSAKVDSLWTAGDYTASREASESAKKFSIYGAIAGAVVAVLWVMLSLFTSVAGSGA